jgi:hypothetical protein
MRKLLKIVAWLAATCLVVVAALVGAAWLMFGDPCGNDVLAEMPSPDKRYRVVVFQRDCGATTGFSTQLSLLRSQQPLGNEGGNVFAADTNHGAAPSGPGGGPDVSVRWVNSGELVVVHHPKARVFLAEPKVSGVRITYSAVEPAAN